MQSGLPNLCFCSVPATSTLVLLMWIFHKLKCVEQSIFLDIYGPSWYVESFAKKVFLNLFFLWSELIIDTFWAIFYARKWKIHFQFKIICNTLWGCLVQSSQTVRSLLRPLASKSGRQNTLSITTKYMQTYILWLKLWQTQSMRQYQISSNSSFLYTCKCIF